jgi:glycosyltransferase involved in cell wall biosynthesis
MIEKRKITLVIQIPAFNEVETLPTVLKEIPRSIPGVDQVIVQVIDDGSHDQTAQVALDNGADFVVRHLNNRGLAHTFITGITHALKLGADIIVNTDADNQYPCSEILKLVCPIIEKEADIVIGDRQPGKNEHFPWYKRILQVIGSGFISYISGAKTPDAASGFRAYSRYAALRLQVFNEFSYTLETIIQSNRERIKIVYIPIQTNETVRPSRLHKGIFNFLLKQGGTIVRSYILYRPLRSALTLGIPIGTVGILLILRFLFFYVTGNSGIARYTQSVSIGGTFFLFGFLIIMVGFIGESIRSNQRMLEEIIIKMRNDKFSDDPSQFDGLEVFAHNNQVIKHPPD